MEGAFDESVRIHSFEAIPGNFERASKWATERTTMINKALTEQQGKTELTINCLQPDCNDEHSTLSAHLSDWHRDTRNKTTYPVVVKAARLDEYIATLDQPPFFVKLDLEGMDFPVIHTLQLGDAKIVSSPANICGLIILPFTPVLIYLLCICPWSRSLGRHRPTHADRCGWRSSTCVTEATFTNNLQLLMIHWDPLRDRL